MPIPSAQNPCLAGAAEAEAGPDWVRASANAWPPIRRVVPTLETMSLPMSDLFPALPLLTAFRSRVDIFKLLAG